MGTHAVRAKDVVAVTVEASCGKCSEALIRSDGSYMIVANEAREMIRCSKCETANILPKTAKLSV